MAQQFIAKYSRSLAASFWILFAFAASAQDFPPRISEFLAVNQSNLENADGDFSDWIELHNPNSTPFNLAGYHLTDDVDDPTKFTFPNDFVLEPGEFKIVFASNQAVSDYRDADGILHTNFGLSSGGEYLALNAPDGSVVHEFAPEFPKQIADYSYGDGDFRVLEELVLHPADGDCRWLVPDSEIGSSWQAADFNDTEWNTASSGVGYGYDDFVGEGGDARSEMWFANATVFLRYSFEIEDLSSISRLALRARYEDGFAAYLNGTLVASSNAPDELVFNSNATDSNPDAEAGKFEEFVVTNLSSLIEGQNVLAIHGLNQSENSSDFLFQPELVAFVSEEDGGNQKGYFSQPTPGAANITPGIVGFVKDTKFSHDRGYYDEPFNLSITTKTTGATIFYTTDGTPPTAENGQIYEDPLEISATTTLRAIATRDGFGDTNIDTQTYLFPEDIVRQPLRRPGYPSSWAGRPADYGMDPDVVDDPAYSSEFPGAFFALPTLSLVFDPDSLFSPSTGIYQRPTNSGSNWERPVSAELMVPGEEEPGFQIDAGIRIQGASARNSDIPKHPFSLRFRSQYGESKLRYPLYDDSPGGENAIDEFDVLQLRPETNFGWVHRHYYQARHAQFGRDQWGHDLFHAMGRRGSHGRWVHLFLNGNYWGLYDLQERPDSSYMANLFGGEKEDYDAVNSGRATEGNLTAYNAMFNLAAGNVANDTVYNRVLEYLDVDTFIDYMILNFYIGNRDWDGHNWRAARKREDGEKFLFFPWDAEFAISHVGGGVFTPPPFESTTLRTDRTGLNNNRNPTGLHRRLSLNANYRLRFADAVQRHFFNDGPLTPDQSAASWTARSNLMDQAIVAESARWGDFRIDLDSGRWTTAQFDFYTKNDHYLPTQSWIMNSYLPQRSEIVLNQFRNRSLYPRIVAPVFSQQGGEIVQGYELAMQADDEIYYTLDGSDPRGDDSQPSESAASLMSGETVVLDQPVLVRARSRTPSGQWSALNEAAFAFGQSKLRLSEIMYHPVDDQAEFLELYNPGKTAIPLVGLKFSDGVDFEFDLHSSIDELAPGERLLIVRDLAAFRAVHGDQHDSAIAGVFQNESALRNSGETISLVDLRGEEIFLVDYGDSGDWPEVADGEGYSLVYSGGDPDQSISWRPSRELNGNPGQGDSLPEGSNYLVNLALDRTSSELVISRQLGVDHVRHSAEFSTDLEIWSADLADLKLNSRSLPVPGIEQLRYRMKMVPLPEQFFARLKLFKE